MKGDVSVRDGVTITDLSDRSASAGLTPEEVEQSLRLEAQVLRGKDTATSSDWHLYHFLDAQPRIKLSSGFYMPLLGLGTWKSEKGQLKTAVETAIRMGYRHVDCAYVYENEAEVGEALKTIFDEGIVGREDLFITGKLWNTSHSPAAVQAAVKRSLRDLGLEYLDLYLIHWPVTGRSGPTLQPPYIDTWSAMEAAADSGLVRSIGVSNLSAKKLEMLLRSCRIKPAVNQVESHPYFRNAALVSFCKLHGIHATAYAPLGSPDSAAIMGRSSNTPGPMQDPVVNEVAKRLGKSPAQVLIRWAVQRGTSVLPKSIHPDRLRSNIDVIEWSLPDEEFDMLNALPTQTRMVAGQMFINSLGPYKSLADLWDE